MTRPTASKDIALARVALEAAFALLHRQLGPWIGIDACTRLIHRSLSRSAALYPGLSGMSLAPTWTATPDPTPLTAISPDAARVVDSFLATLFEHLGRLVGDDVAVRLVSPPKVVKQSNPRDADQDELSSGRAR